jgi:hypothetical protein
VEAWERVGVRAVLALLPLPLPWVSLLSGCVCEREDARLRWWCWRLPCGREGWRGGVEAEVAEETWEAAWAWACVWVSVGLRLSNVCACAWVCVCVWEGPRVRCCGDSAKINPEAEAEGSLAEAEAEADAAATAAEDVVDVAERKGDTKECRGLAMEMCDADAGSGSGSGVDPPPTASCSGVP